MSRVVGHDAFDFPTVFVGGLPVRDFHRDGDGFGFFLVNLDGGFAQGYRQFGSRAAAGAGAFRHGEVDGFVTASGVFHRDHVVHLALALPVLVSLTFCNDEVHAKQSAAGAVSSGGGHFDGFLRGWVGDIGWRDLFVDVGRHRGFATAFCGLGQGHVQRGFLNLTGVDGAGELRDG